MSYEKDDEIHIEDDEARGASSPGIMRWVLGISLILAIVALTIVWIIPYLSGATR